MDRRLLALLIVLAIASSAVLVYFVFEIPRGPEARAKYQVAAHSSIIVGSDSDFTEPGAGSGCECVRSGSGRQGDPYLISDWTINSSRQDGIVISGTSVYVVIARVKLQGKHLNGMYFDAAQNVIVEDCEIKGYLNGIFALASSNLEFINNTVTGNQYGIELEASNDNKLIANRFDDNGQLGIFVRGSNNILKDNSATGNEFGGINIDGTASPADANVVEGNIVSENKVYGIGVWRGAKNVMRSNTVMYNLVVGIMLTDHSTSNLIEGNTVSHNAGSGVVLTDGSSGNTISGNTARGNGDGVNDFDLYDNCSDNVWQNNTYDTKKPDSID